MSSRMLRGCSIVELESTDIHLQITLKDSTKEIVLTADTVLVCHLWGVEGWSVSKVGEGGGGGEKSRACYAEGTSMDSRSLGGFM